MGIQLLFTHLILNKYSVEMSRPRHGRVYNLGLKITCFPMYKSRMKTKMRENLKILKL